MRIPRIFCKQALASGIDIDLDESGARHVGKVLRMQTGRSLLLFNGDGGEYEASIIDVGKKNVRVRVGEFNSEDRQSPLCIHLGIGISRGERFEHVLQKATELGVTQITPLFTERTEVKLTGPRLEKKHLQWQQIIVSSCEQCQRNRLPVLTQPLRYDAWISEVEAEQRFVLHHRSSRALADNQKPASVALVVGPEGGLSSMEIDSALQQQFQPLTLGPRVFRTETAPLAAISIMQYLWGDLS